MLELNQHEIAIIGMALQTTIEDLQETMSNPRLPFTPEARSHMREMKSAGESALEKIKSATGLVVPLAEYKPGDENEFLTKQS